MLTQMKTPANCSGPRNKSIYLSKNERGISLAFFSVNIRNPHWSAETGDYILLNAHFYYLDPTTISSIELEVLVIPAHGGNIHFLGNTAALRFNFSFANSPFKSESLGIFTQKWSNLKWVNLPI